MNSRSWENRLIEVSLETISVEFPDFAYRIRRRLRRRRLVATLFITAAGLGMLFGLFLFRTATAPPLLTVLEAPRFSKIQEGEHLPLNRWLQFTDRGHWRLSWEGGTLLKLTGPAHINFRWPPSGKRRILLRTGKIQCTLPKHERDDNEKLSVVTPFFEVTVKGTVFTLSHTKDQGSLLLVERGEVAVMGKKVYGDQSKRQHVLVEAGYGIRMMHADDDLEIISLEDASRKPVFFFDFSHGTGSKGDWAFGKPARAPDGRHCLQGVANYPWAQGWSTICLKTDDRTGLASYHSGMYLECRYWVTPGVTEIVLQLWNETQQQNYQYIHKVRQWQNWQTIRVKLSEFQPVTDKKRHWHEGDRINNLLLIGGTSSNTVSWFNGIGIFR